MHGRPNQRALPQLLMHAITVRSCVAAFGAAVGLGRGVNATMVRLHSRELLSRLTRAGRDRLYIWGCPRSSQRSKNLVKNPVGLRLFVPNCPWLESLRLPT